jgi:ankyrin repeat protein
MDDPETLGPCSLSHLPSEILLQISSYLDLPALNALTQLNHSTTSLLQPSLYKLDARQSSQALCWAAIHNNPQIAQSSLSAGANPTTVTDQDTLIKGCTPLMLAAYHGSLPVLSLLLTHPETNPNSRDRKYIRPPITWAIKHRHAAIVRALLKDDRTDPNLQDKFGDTALMIAVTLRPDMIPVLLGGSRVDPRVSNTQGATALSRASQRGVEVDLILATHLRFILDGDESAAHCQHVFFYAAISGHVEIVEYLVEYFGDRLDPNGVSLGTGMAMAMGAGNGAANGVGAGHNNGHTNGNGHGPGHGYSHSHSRSNSGAGHHGRGAFSIAVERGHISVVRYLLGWEKTDPNLSDSWKHQCPLLLAAIAGDESMVSALVECERVDLLNPDVSGTTPLHAAVERNHVDVVKLLLQTLRSRSDLGTTSGPGPGGTRIADVNARNSSGQTPLHIAVLQDYDDLVMLLLEAGADPQLTCAEGLTALDQGDQWCRDGRAMGVLREYMRKL